MQNLCITTTCFPNEDNSYYGGIFIKRELEELSKYFKKVHVIVPTARGTLQSRCCQDYAYRNINVYFPLYLHLPFHFFRTLSGEKHITAIKNIIDNNELKFDIIYSHFLWQAGYASIKIKEIYQVPTVVVGHGTDIREPLTTSKIWLKDKLDYTVKNADTVLVNHEELKDLLLNDYEEYMGKIKYNHKGIDLNKFGGIKTINKDKFVVLFVGNMNEFKDPKTFIECANILINILNRKDIIFKIIGVGPLAEECWSMIYKYKLKEFVKYINGVNNIEEYYRNCDVCCNISPIENIWSTTLQEALCSNKPCIVTKAGYTERTLTHKKDAYLIDIKRPEKLAEAILKIKKDDKLRYRLSNTKWKKEFNLAKTTMKLYTIMRTTKCH